jgi:hypothetical protein
LNLCIRDLALHERDGARWVSWPARPQIDTRTGMVRKDEHNRVCYAPVLEFYSDEARDAFRTRIIAALLARFPDAFQSEEVAR